MVCPVGHNVPKAWANLVAGVSGIRPITRFDASDLPVRIAGTIEDFDVESVLSRKEAQRLDTFIHYGVAAAVEAISAAQLEITATNAERIGVAVGSGIGGLAGIERNHTRLQEGGARKVSPFFVPGSIVNMMPGVLSIHYGLGGPNLSVVTACTSGTHSIGEAARLIAYGDADAMVAGGTEMATTPLGVSGFAAARALSTRNDEPEAASRPFERDRDGFVLAEGAGVLVLESLDHATARDAPILAELIGFGMSADAYHVTQPAPDGAGARRCMASALRDAAINPETVDYINAHGTSTPAGDRVEAEAVRSLFGDYARRLPVSSTKSMTGHLLGAAGGVEAVCTVLALRDQVAPPTINHRTPDPECDLDCVPNTARDHRMTVAMSNSFGFGGTNGSLVFRRMP